MAIVKVSTKGQVVIPAALRRRFNVRAGTRVQVVAGEGRIVILPSMKDPIKEAMGMFKGKESLVETLLEMRRQDKAHEDRLLS